MRERLRGVKHANTHIVIRRRPCIPKAVFLLFHFKGLIYLLRLKYFNELYFVIMAPLNYCCGKDESLDCMKGHDGK